MTVQPGSSGYGGCGIRLGLPIAKTLVEGLHGVITIESRPEEGSTVRVRLPRLEESPADD